MHWEKQNFSFWELKKLALELLHIVVWNIKYFSKYHNMNWYTVISTIAILPSVPTVNHAIS